MTTNSTLLFVEDDAVIRENLTEIFEAYFSKVISTDNGNEALELYNNNTIDVAILDISINGINGLNVAQKIRAKDDKIIILIISAHSEKDKLLKAINLGLSGYLVKPIKHDELIKTLDNITKQLNSNSFTQFQNHFAWDMSQNILTYKNIPTKLTKNEVKVIQLLAENQNSYLSACEIQDRLFEKEETQDTACNNIVQLLSRLKKKIITINESEDYFIENCYGTGYKIIVN